MSNKFRKKTSKEEYQELLEEGKKLFWIIGDDLNKVSDEFIRTHESLGYRRKVDFEEICAALALMRSVTS